ncbi:hypothetical protein [Nocardia cyriacigeorgica]|uniref:hypothetical protein n=1 Tax=Nocardia cyriacigeorgica TaxID=135487 RepID=UPI001E568383|nr:hypothetical protein [Nocardia cyriacigeorgica]
MSSEVRSLVVTGLIRLAGSPDYRDRAAAGRALAIFAEMPEASRALMSLLLDASDTFVTRVTAEASLRRLDRTGLAVVATGLAAADSNCADWIHTAVVDVFGMSNRVLGAAMQECQVLTQSPDERVRRGARVLLAMLGEINSVSRPQGI